MTQSGDGDLLWLSAAQRLESVLESGWVFGAVLGLTTTASQNCEAVPRKDSKAHRLVHHSTLGSRVMKRKRS